MPEVVVHLAPVVQLVTEVEILQVMELQTPGAVAALMLWAVQEFVLFDMQIHLMQPLVPQVAQQ
jgi:hypothetical protein